MPFDISMADPQQVAAIEKGQEWSTTDGGPQVFYLFGYAGVGKTTLAQEISSAVRGEVMYGAFTGKAAYVMDSKGCDGATTIHQMIYRSKEKSRLELWQKELRLKKLLVGLGLLPEDMIRATKNVLAVPGLETVENGEAIKLVKEITKEREWLKQPYFLLNPDSDVPSAKLVVIDECSMVDGKMGEDLLSFGTKVMVLGDPAQLPPVGGAGFFTKNKNPDVLLTRIHRQSADNPILIAATQVRQEKGIPRESMGNYNYLPRGVKTAEELLGFDQILVGRNKTRHTLNRRIRQLLGRGGSPYPVNGDRLVCLRNNHEKALMNGAIYSVHSVKGLEDERIEMEVVPEVGGEPIEVMAHHHTFVGEDLNDLSWSERKEAEEFDYGYALTVHKSQGSEWDNVLLYDESFCFREHKHRWLYTGITRAAKNLTVVPA